MSVLETVAFPLGDIPRFFRATEERFELSTCRLEDDCSVQLSYSVLVGVERLERSAPRSQSECSTFELHPGVRRGDLARKPRNLARGVASARRRRSLGPLRVCAFGGSWISSYLTMLGGVKRIFPFAPRERLELSLRAPDARVLPITLSGNGGPEWIRTILYQLLFQLVISERRYRPLASPARLERASSVP